MEPDVLVVNIGNTNTTVARCSRGRVRARAHLPSAERNAAALSDALQSVLSRRAPDGVALASAVPRATPRWRRALRTAGLPQPLEAHHDLELGLRLSYPRPETIGADRLADLCGAVACYGTPLLVCDFGTAATFNVVSRKRGFVGGVIAPGPDLMLDALAVRTALLPRPDSAPVRRAIGRNTAESMRIGAATGYAGLVRAILDALRREPGLRDAPVIATGGGARAALRGLERGVVIDPDLTLLGLSRLWELNAPAA